MSYHTGAEPECTTRDGCIALVIEPRQRDLGEFTVRRVLPSARRRMVGPFIFFDHMGPADFPPGKGIAVRPHPHIGLATVTYLFEGEIMHRDSLGVVQAIGPGAVNLMTAGRGIVHSERAGDDVSRHARLHGIQTWMALPDGHEDIAPDFRHVPADALPIYEDEGVSARLIIGSAFGLTSPVPMHSPTLYAELHLAAGACLTLPDDAIERAVYVVDGSVTIEERTYGAGVMAVACEGAAITLEAGARTHLMLAGGAPIGDRHISWNFVASTRERIDEARKRWRDGGFERVPGDDEFIPLPD